MNMDGRDKLNKSKESKIKREKLSKKRIAMILLFSLVFIYSLYSLIDIWVAYEKNQRLAGDMQKEFMSDLIPQSNHSNIPPKTEVPLDEPERYMGVNIDFDNLKKINSDIIGWIMIPDTKINYPLVQARDNEKYLNRAADGKYSRLGSIFTDYRNHGDLSDRNTIIYGHNTKNGSMFGQLKLFLGEEFLPDHPYFYIFNEEGNRAYEIFSAYITDAYSDSYTLNLNNDEDYASYIKMISGEARTGIDVEVDMKDKIITLSTCTSSGRKTERVVVHGKLSTEKLIAVD